jgi:hypothetical protein
MYQDTTILLPKTTPLVRPDINVPRYNNTTKLFPSKDATPLIRHYRRDSLITT